MRVPAHPGAGMRPRAVLVIRPLGAFAQSLSTKQVALRNWPVYPNSAFRERAARSTVTRDIQAIATLRPTTNDDMSA
jgi:hypothetical protein